MSVPASPQHLVPDFHSFARPQEAVVTHLNLQITVDFAQKIIQGEAAYNLNSAPDAREIILDTKGLVIERVFWEDARETAFTLEAEIPNLGQALRIPITPETRKISIKYSTTAQAAALQWLSPEQTAGKHHPFLFTQSQVILARTWMPCQDSPGIRFTYEATVHVPPGNLALMSAQNPQQKNESGLYRFSMAYPIPSYLMALAVGHLDYRAVSETTGVYAEPSQLEAAAYEFAELPQMLAAAEALYGNYLWERYDLLLLPPSFPFGGMENPMLTFVTPTIIAGDRSLTSLVAHELAHSWSGNLVTNATWNDFWLNEGFTVYFERRIMEALYGKDYADMLKVLGYQDLLHTVSEIGPQSADTHLKLNLLNRDPDEGLTEIAYEKGNYFLLTLEAAVGRDKFDAFVRQYFQEFAFQSMHTESFVAYLRETLLTDPALWQQVNPEAWIFGPGIPVGGPALSAIRFAQVQKQVTNWQNGTQPADLETAHWYTHEWLYFLNAIPAALDANKIQELDAAFNFTNSGNSEIIVLWLQQAIRHRYTPADVALEAFLLRVGRRKFLVPLYKELLQHDAERARAIYQKARPNYHAVATSTLDALLEAAE